jgi:hypothetical protein
MRKRYPGKFEGCADDRLAEVLYSISTGGGCTEEIGSVDELGWFGLIIHRKHAYIVSEDSQGFYDYAYYETKEEAQKEYDKIESAIADEYDEPEESEG